MIGDRRIHVYAPIMIASGIKWVGGCSRETYGDQLSRNFDTLSVNAIVILL
jgi:hypothetical protein